MRAPNKKVIRILIVMLVLAGISASEKSEVETLDDINYWMTQYEDYLKDMKL